MPLGVARPLTVEELLGVDVGDAVPEPDEEPVGVGLDDGVFDAVGLIVLDGVSLTLLVKDGLEPMDKLGVAVKEALGEGGELCVLVIDDVSVPEDVGDPVPVGVLVIDTVSLGDGNALLVTEGLAPILSVVDGVLVALGVSAPLGVDEAVGVIVGDGVEVPVNDGVGVPVCVGVIEDDADGGSVPREVADSLAPSEGALLEEADDVCDKLVREDAVSRVLGEAEELDADEPEKGTDTEAVELPGGDAVSTPVPDADERDDADERRLELASVEAVALPEKDRKSVV